MFKGQGNSEDDLNAYWPIAVLSNVSKLLSTVLNCRLQGYCETNGILIESQNGFRPHRRTSDHIFTLTQAMEIKQEDKSRHYLAFLDMERACDSIPHQKAARQAEGPNLLAF